MLKALDKSVKSGTNSLSAVAKSHELFVGPREHFQIEHGSWKELLPQLVRVTNLLDTLRRTPSSKVIVKTFAESDEGIDLSFDEDIAANLEHLLLCLKEQLIRLLIAELRELVRTHIVECQREQKQHTKDLLLEFPDGRHPLSTTWPWSIRPSLAVLWGVCWMFYTYYDSQGNMRDHNNNIIATAQSLQEWNVDQPENPQFRQYQGQQNQNQNQTQTQNQNQQTPQYSGGMAPQAFAREYWKKQQVLTMQTGNFARQARTPHGSPGDQQTPRMMNAHHSPVMTLSMTQPHSQHPFFGGQPVATSHPPFIRESFVPDGRACSSSCANVAAAAPDQATHAVGGAFHSNNNAFSAAPPAYVGAPPASVGFNSLPEDFSSDFQYHTSPNTYPSGPWMPPNTVQESQPSNYYAQSVANAYSGIPAPDPLRVDTSSLALAQPQDFNNLSATPISATSNPGSNYGPYLRPQDSPHDVRARSSIPMTQVETPQQPYTTPKSESPVPAALIAQNPRKRSFGEMAEGENGQHSRNGSRAGSEGHPHYHQPSGDDESPGRHRSNTTISRPDPPTNKEGKYICTYSPECEDQTFDRKCEWNKHMDKHDRPYRCTHPDCAKLQGFTYSGGLLRHEREVHGKHGGPKTQLMCNYPDCKRKNKGFTRKENLNEHIRRVHSKESQSQASMKRDGTDVSAIAGALQDDAETPSRYSESGIEHDESLVSPTQQSKRRRLNSNIGDQTEVELLRQNNEDLRAQVAQIQQENEQLRQMLQAQQSIQQSAPGQG